jgi:hypothetical protein
MKELSLNKLENLEGGKFFGWTTLSTNVVDDSSCASGSREEYKQEYRVLWFISASDIRTVPGPCTLF